MSDTEEKKPFWYLDPHFTGPKPPEWTPAPPSPQERESERLLALGDSWRALLKRRAPGRTFLVIELDGKQAAAVPLGNLLHIGAELDPDGASTEQRYIAKLRQEVWDWQSKYTDQLANEAMIAKLRGEFGARPAAPPTDALLGERYQMLLFAAKDSLRKCRCGGVDPCLGCAMLRAVVALQTGGAA